MRDSDPKAPAISVDPTPPGLPEAGDALQSEAPPEYWRAFSILGFTMNRFVMDQVLRASRMFDDDIEAMILFGTLAHLNIAHLLTPEWRPSEKLGPDGRVPDLQSRLRPVRLRDLVELTRRPRETVRRKLEQLQAAGKVQRLDDGWVYRVDAVDCEMRTQCIASVERFLRAAAVMRAALEDAKRAVQSESQGAAADDPEPFPE